MKFHVGQYVKLIGPLHHFVSRIAVVTRIDPVGGAYPIRIEIKEQNGWNDYVTEDGLLHADEPKDDPDSVYIEPLTKLERLLLGLE
jgi:hypothetical protein